MLDGHWNYTLNEAQGTGRTQGLWRSFLGSTTEQSRGLRESQRTAGQRGLDIALGEGERNRLQYRDILENAADILQPDIGRVGITEFLRIVHLAEAHGVRVAPHLSTHLGVAIAASIHLRQRYPTSLCWSISAPLNLAIST